MKPRHPIYALPTLLTLGNLLCGFFAIALIGGWNSPYRLPVAAGLIPLALLFDGFDGVIARKLGMASRFGAQLDSLADLVSFGVTPAMLVVALCTKPGLPPAPALWAVAAWMLCATALRLARFTTETDENDNHSTFEGLPCPAAATLVAGIALALYTAAEHLTPETHAFAAIWTRRLLPAVAIGLGLLMVSRIPYPHLTTRLLRRPMGFLPVAAVSLTGVAVLALGGYAPALLCGLFVASPLLAPARRFATGESHSARG